MYLNPQRSGNFFAPCHRAQNASPACPRPDLFRLRHLRPRFCSIAVM